MRFSTCNYIIVLFIFFALFFFSVYPGYAINNLSFNVDLGWNVKYTLSQICLLGKAVREFNYSIDSNGFMHKGKLWDSVDPDTFFKNFNHYHYYTIMNSMFTVSIQSTTRVSALIQCGLFFILNPFYISSSIVPCVDYLFDLKHNYLISPLNMFSNDSNRYCY